MTFVLSWELYVCLFIYLRFNLIVKKNCILNDSLTIKLFYLDYFYIKYIYYMYIVKIIPLKNLF